MFRVLHTAHNHLAESGGCPQTSIVLHLTALAAAAVAVPAVLTGRPAAAAAAVTASVALHAAAWAASHAEHRARLQAAVAEARRDPLTGLPTRAVVDQLLHAATHRRTRVSVALIDVDGLHAVNAAFGHAAGDQYLQAVAERLTRAVPPGGVLARQGGDEFTLIAHTAPEALSAAIRTAMTGPAVIAGRRMQPGVSVGIATSRDGHHARACADAAMYSAKGTGGNHALIYQPDRDGEPAADGTRPLVRRRDLDPTRAGSVVWQPAPGDELLPLLCTIDEARALHTALHHPRHGEAPDRTSAGVVEVPGLLAGLARRIEAVIEAAETTQAGRRPSRPSTRAAAATFDPAAADRWLRSPNPRHPEHSNAEALGVDDEHLARGSGGFLSVVDDVLAEQPNGLVYRADVEHVALWRIPDGDVLDQGALITVDLVNGIRLATLHQDIKDFAGRDASGTPAVLSALEHIAAQASRLVAAYQAANPAHQVPPA